MHNNIKAIITGGANGIGKAIASLLVLNGCQVRIVDIDSHAGNEFVRLHPNVIFHNVDVTDEASIKKLFEDVKSEWGYCNVLINNAAISKFVSLKDCSTAFWDKIMAVNLRAPFIFSREFALLHPGNAYGRIINIASTRYIMSEPSGEAYGASKGGLVSLTHSLANSLANTAITVNCIAPGWINNGDENHLTEADHLQHPSGRVGKPSDIASMVWFLCDSNSDFINGEEIRIDGGMTRKMIYV